MIWSRWLPKIDWLILIPVFLLLTLGVLMIYSATLGESGADKGNTYRQIIYIAIGVGLMLVVGFFDYRIFRGYSRWLYLIMIISLVAVLFLGTPIRGTRSWFDLGVVNLQPSELAKFFCIIVLAKYFSKHADEMTRFRHILISGLMVLFPVLLIMAEPDFGSAMVIILLWVGMILLTRVRWWQLGAVFGGLAGLVALGWKFFLRDYQKERIKVFLNPALDPLGRGYNVTQAKIAIGSGSWFGHGLGHGSQSQLNFLPEQHTDFIFAVLCEELGFIGGAFMVALFGFLFYRLYRVGRQTKDRFGLFLVGGVTVLILIQVLINVGMNVGLLPVAGIPLPFMSFGGSSILTLLLCVGLVLSVSYRSPSKTKPAIG